jgi:hypothetical protein
VTAARHLLRARAALDMRSAAKSPSWAYLDYASGCDDQAVDDLARASA